MASKENEEANNDVFKWSVGDVGQWLHNHDHRQYVDTFKNNKIDGRALLSLREKDLRLMEPLASCLGDLKRIWLDIQELKWQCQSTHDRPFISSAHPNGHGWFDAGHQYPVMPINRHQHPQTHHYQDGRYIFCSKCGHMIDQPSPYYRQDITPFYITSDRLKALVAVAYALSSFLISAIVMTIVHERVPDKKVYPPLPDIVLDNIPVIPYSFELCEITGKTRHHLISFSNANYSCNHFPSVNQCSYFDVTGSPAIR